MRTLPLRSPGRWLRLLAAGAGLLAALDRTVPAAAATAFLLRPLLLQRLEVLAGRSGASRALNVRLNGRRWSGHCSRCKCTKRNASSGQPTSSGRTLTRSTPSCRPRIAATALLHGGQVDGSLSMPSRTMPRKPRHLHTSGGSPTTSLMSGRKCSNQSLRTTLSRNRMQIGIELSSTCRWPQSCSFGYLHVAAGEATL